MVARRKPGRRRLSFIHRGGRRVRLTAERCCDCRRKLLHPGAKHWRALGSKIAIRCLDCRMAFCPRCAKRHFAPVAAAHDKMMNAVVNAAIKVMRRKCREAA